MSNKKQTAVEWFFENENYLYSQLMFSKIDIIEYEKRYKQSVEQAKAMEKEQMKEMYLKGIENYDPTFKRNL